MTLTKRLSKTVGGDAPYKDADTVLSFIIHIILR